MPFDQLSVAVLVKTTSGELVMDEDLKFPDMVPPFTPVDREMDYRVTWKFLENRFN